MNFQMMIQYKNEISNLKIINDSNSEVIESLKKSSRGKKVEDLELKIKELEKYCLKLTKLKSTPPQKNDHE